MIAGAWLLILHQAAVPQTLPSLCAKVEPIGGPLGYQRRGGGQRCEGFYQPSVSGERIDLLSLTYTRPKNVESLSFLHIQAVVRDKPAPSDAVTVHVVGLSLVPDTFYRLDAVLSAKAPSTTLPLSQVIGPGQLDVSQIGFVGYSSNSIVPLAIQLANTSEPPNSLPTLPISVTIALSTFATEVIWHWKPGCPSARPDQSSSRLPGSTFLPHVPLSFPLVPLPQQMCTLEVGANPSGGPWIWAEWTVDVPQQ
jgi:hypothetical protein